jgi:hypothetical protein
MRPGSKNKAGLKLAVTAAAVTAATTAVETAPAAVGAAAAAVDAATITVDAAARMARHAAVIRGAGMVSASAI